MTFSRSQEDGSWTFPKRPRRPIGRVITKGCFVEKRKRVLIFFFLGWWKVSGLMVKASNQVFLREDPVSILLSLKGWSYRWVVERPWCLLLFRFYIHVENLVFCVSSSYSKSKLSSTTDSGYSDRHLHRPGLWGPYRTTIPPVLVSVVQTSDLTSSVPILNT